LPGGRVEALETTSDALRREMKEEIGQTIEVGRLLWVVENFFNLQGTPYHEFKVTFNSDDVLIFDNPVSGEYQDCN
jgi:ADP-ribose pyrophosphatase YjhB (NUDIX family)